MSSCIDSGNKDASISGISSRISGNNVLINFLIPSIAIFILGNKFSPREPKLLTKFCTNTSKLALESAIPVSRFFHADLVIFRLPSIVVAASFAVVPVIPICSWIT